jgi:hypothetical protein
VNLKLSEAEQIYLRNLVVLEETRQQLLGHLDHLWDQVWQGADSRIHELADAADAKLQKWDNKSDPGEHSLELQGKQTIRFRLIVRDPRRTLGGYTFVLECVGQERAKIEKDKEAKHHFERLAKDAGIQPLKWDRSQVWSKELPFIADDIDATVSSVIALMSDAFKLITDFVEWHRRRAGTGQKGIEEPPAGASAGRGAQ